MSKVMVVCTIAVAASVAIAAPAFADKISYVGSSTINKFLRDAGEVYTVHTFVVDTVPESSGGEVCPLRSGCDMGGVARAVDPAVLREGVVATLIGRDAIGVVVHPSNPVENLSSEQLRGIFTGKITNWSEVGGPNASITPYVVKAGSATRTVFQSVVLEGAEYGGAKVVEPDARMIPTVARDPNAIGQISFAFAIADKSVRYVDVDGQPATVDNPNYPITRPLNITTKGEPKGPVADFIAWTLSPAGQTVVRRNFIGVK